MSDETYRNVSRWSGLIILIVVNFGVTQRLVVSGVEAACQPYARICSMINPSALRLIFPK
jgi:hypothetical protein